MDLNYSKEKIRRIMNENRKKGEEITFLRRRLELTSQESTRIRDELESMREKYVATEEQLRNTLFELFGLQEENGKLHRQIERLQQIQEEMKTLQTIQEEAKETEIFELQEITQPIENPSEEHLPSEEHPVNLLEESTLETKNSEVTETKNPEVTEATPENISIKSYWLVNGWW